MQDTHTLWHVIASSSIFLGNVSLRTKRTRCWNSSTHIIRCSKASRVYMDGATSGQAISLIIKCLIYGINSTPLVILSFGGRLHAGLPPRQFESYFLEKCKDVNLIHGGKCPAGCVSSFFHNYLTSSFLICVQAIGTGPKLKYCRNSLSYMES